jgi:hypothetical protein
MGEMSFTSGSGVRVGVGLRVADGVIGSGVRLGVKLGSGVVKVRSAVAEGVLEGSGSRVGVLSTSTVTTGLDAHALATNNKKQITKALVLPIIPAS